MSDPADTHDEHHRDGADTSWIEVCWRCALDWVTYMTAHPEEWPRNPADAPGRAGEPIPVVLAQPPARS
jgi:hypothetical protein